MRIKNKITIIGISLFSAVILTNLQNQEVKADTTDTTTVPTDSKSDNSTSSDSSLAEDTSNNIDTSNTTNDTTVTTDTSDSIDTTANSTDDSTNTASTDNTDITTNSTDGSTNTASTDSINTTNDTGSADTSETGTETTSTNSTDNDGTENTVANSTTDTSTTDSQTITSIPITFKTTSNVIKTVYLSSDTPSSLTGTYTEGQTLTATDLPESLLNIPGYTFSSISNSTISLDSNGNVNPITLTYVINNNSSYTLTYIDEDTGETVGVHSATDGTLGNTVAYTEELLTDAETNDGYDKADYYVDYISPNNRLTEYNGNFTVYLKKLTDSTYNFTINQTNSSGDTLIPQTTLTFTGTKDLYSTISMDSSQLDVADLEVDWDKSTVSAGAVTNSLSIYVTHFGLDDTSTIVDLINKLGLSTYYENINGSEYRNYTFNVVYKTYQNTLSYQTSDGTEVGTGTAEDGLDKTISTETITSQLPSGYELADSDTVYKISDSSDPITILVQKETTSGGSSGSGSDDDSSTGTDTGIDVDTGDDNSETDSGSENSDIFQIDDTVSTYPDAGDVELYDDEGNTTIQTLKENTDWKTDEKKAFNGELYYRVATNTWVKASSVYLYYTNPVDVRTYFDSSKSLISTDGQTITRKLSAGSDWFSDRYAYFNGVKYYRVALNEWVKASDVYEYESIQSVVTPDSSISIYDDTGNIISKTIDNYSYKADKIATINGVKMYHVATNEWIAVSEIN